MKVTEGAITQQEYEKFKTLASHSTRSLAFNILIAFGVITVYAARH